MSGGTDAVQLSVVVPVHNERDNVAPLFFEIMAAMRSTAIDYEVIFVDDASNDDTLQVLRSLKREHPWLRVIRHLQRAGQSTALRNGVKAARAVWVVTLDGDGQNDPADIVTLLTARDEASATMGLFAGWRSRRHDHAIRRLSSKIANATRSAALGDATPDTGCGLKLFQRAVFLDLPYFSHMHRFLPALFQRAGFQVQSVAVSHRPRTGGVSKYGIWDRLWVGLVDIAGVMWLRRRSSMAEVIEE